MYRETIWVTAHYSLDSPNQPANHEAPERDNCFQLVYSAMTLNYYEAHIHILT